jgi:acylphosphatase
MQAALPMPYVSEHFALCGQVGSGVFPVWIRRHARRLGLGLRLLGQNAARLEMIVSGPPDLLDAMALACSLGPQEVWVDQVDRFRANDPLDAEFSSPPA